MEDTLDISERNGGHHPLTEQQIFEIIMVKKNKKQQTSRSPLCDLSTRTKYPIELLIVKS
jgi:hypothetical protein